MSVGKWLEFFAQLDSCPKLHKPRRNVLSAAETLGKGKSHPKTQERPWGKEEAGRCGATPACAARGCAEVTRSRAEPRGEGAQRDRRDRGFGPGAAPPEATFPIFRFSNPKYGRNFSGVAVFSCFVLFWKGRRSNPLQEPVSKSLF